MDPRKTIPKIYEKRKASIYAYARFYAGKSLEFFLSEQKSGQKWWDNQTSQAVDRFFTRAFRSGSAIGYIVAHGVDYGVELTLANDRKRDALTPVLKKYSDDFINDVKNLYKDFP